MHHMRINPPCVYYIGSRFVPAEVLGSANLLD